MARPNRELMGKVAVVTGGGGVICSGYRKGSRSQYVKLEVVH
ncbi:MAG: hypothetical protein ACUVTL_04725 [Thermoproteota archaeon]